MSKQKISIINGIEIYAEVTENGIFVPVKPICQALGIDFAAQYNKLQADETLAPTIAIITTVASDEKAREMICLPLQYVYGWLFTINPGKVAPESKATVTRYRLECYNILYRHFTGSLTKQLDSNAAEIKCLKDINDAITREKEAKADRAKAEKALAQIRASRLDPAPTLEFD